MVEVPSRSEARGQTTSDWTFAGDWVHWGGTYAGGGQASLRGPSMSEGVWLHWEDHQWPRGPGFTGGAPMCEAARLHWGDHL